MSTFDLSSKETIANLRNAALTKFPAELSRKFGISDSVAIGVYMEMWSSDSIVSLICFIDGNASLYFSTGGGILGGVSHKPVRIAATKFVQFANMYLPEMSPCKEFSLPKADYTNFYVMTPSAAFSESVLDAELIQGEHPFSQLFCVGNCVTTCLRLVEERKASAQQSKA